jgi:hypothetical protein
MTSGSATSTQARDITCLLHLIPEDYYRAQFADSIWFELAPGEDPESIEYPDHELISAIKPDVLSTLKACGFFTALDELLYPKSAGSMSGNVQATFATQSTFSNGAALRSRIGVMCSTSSWTREPFAIARCSTTSPRKAACVPNTGEAHTPQSNNSFLTPVAPARSRRRSAQKNYAQICMARLRES